jgi:hypothetical protein
MAVDIGREGCIANPSDDRCACHNLMTKDCNMAENSSLPGCSQALEWENSLIGALPISEAHDSQVGLVKRSIKDIYHCAPGVCNPEDEYIPQSKKDKDVIGACNFKINICKADLAIRGDSVNIDNFMDCEINENRVLNVKAIMSSTGNEHLNIRTAEHAGGLAYANRQIQNEEYKAYFDREALRREEQRIRRAAFEKDILDESQRRSEARADAQSEQYAKFYLLALFIVVFAIILILNIM